MSLCGNPPVVLNGQVANGNTTAEYSCGAGFQMSGSKVISCDASSGWASPPSCTLIDTKDTIYAHFAPDWLLYLLGVLMTLLTLSCIACSIYYCCCRAAGAMVAPMGGGVASGGSCCPCGKRSTNSSFYERNNIRHSDMGSTSNNHHEINTINHTTRIHDTTDMHTDMHPTDHANGVYTTHDGLILVPVKPYEMKQYQTTNSSRKAYRLNGAGGPTRSDTNGSVPRSDKEGNDVNFKTVSKSLPLWMPHSKPLRDNNQVTH